jgi:phosphatidylserine/phosphatidylglycerophosphate/cardiolipin synthase-like enzyme
LIRPLRLLLLALFVALPAFADRARLIETDREAAEARVEMVLEAREEILAESFIMGHDPLTLTGLALLRAAARRGIDVKVIVDAQWNKIPAAVQDHLLAEGIEIREYHPFRLDRPQWITRRMHDKLLVIDGKALMAGGRNVESPYFGLGKQIKRRSGSSYDLTRQEIDPLKTRPACSWRRSYHRFRACASRNGEGSPGYFGSSRIVSGVHCRSLCRRASISSG